jgi:hypothetical protein
MSKLRKKKKFLEAITPSSFTFVYMYYKRIYNTNLIYIAKAVDWFDCTKQRWKSNMGYMAEKKSSAQI